MRLIAIVCSMVLLVTAQTVSAQTPTPDYRQMVPVGTILLWTGNSTPAGWLVADGSCVSQASYPELYAVIGSQYSGGATSFCSPGTFGLPDMRGRVPVGAGTGQSNVSPYPTLTARTAGNLFGAETVALSITQMPAHTHSYGWITSNTPGGATSGTGRYITGLTTGTTGSAGAGQPFSILPPSVVVNYIINAGTKTLVLPPTATAVPTSTPAPTATPQPTSTPAPTATPQPTWTVMPTNTPVPTFTPSPQVVVYSTVEANGTAQTVAFAYSMTAGDVLVSVLLFFTCALLVLMMITKARSK